MKRLEKPSELPGITGKGVAPLSIPEVEKAAKQYVRNRDARMEESKAEKDAKTKLIRSLHDNADKIGKDRNGAIVYRYEDMQVVLSPGKEDVKVKNVHSSRKKKGGVNE